MKRIFPAVKLRPQTRQIDEIEIGDAAIPFPGKAEYMHSSPAAPHPTIAISQWARSLEWCHAAALQFFPFSCEACSLYLVLWLCAWKTCSFVKKKNILMTNFWRKIKNFLTFVIEKNLVPTILPGRKKCVHGRKEPAWTHVCPDYFFRRFSWHIALDWLFLSTGCLQEIQNWIQLLFNYYQLPHQTEFKHL